MLTGLCLPFLTSEYMIYNTSMESLNFRMLFIETTPSFFLDSSLILIHYMSAVFMNEHQNLTRILSGVAVKYAMCRRLYRYPETRFKGLFVEILLLCMFAYFIQVTVI